MPLYTLADAIFGTDAESILMGQPYRSFCQGSDTLVSLGLWDADGQESDSVKPLRAIIRQRRQDIAEDAVNAPNYKSFDDADIPACDPRD